jgi:hypothetical protein
LGPTYPFASTPFADAILRSSDGADFYVIRGILFLLSPVFKRLPEVESTLALPVVELQENSAALDMALRFVYPGTEPIFASLDDLRDTIEIVIAKYDMQCEVPKAKRHLQGFCSSHPLGVYGIASRYRWKEVALAAAKETLKHPLRTMVGPAPEDVKEMSAVAYHNLLHYHYLCGEAAQRTVQDLTWVTGRPFRHHGWHIPATSQTTLILGANPSYKVPTWFSEFLTAMGAVLVITPDVDIRYSPIFYAALGNTRCPSICAISDEFLDFATVEWPNKLKAEINKACNILHVQQFFDLLGHRST